MQFEEHLDIHIPLKLNFHKMQEKSDFISGCQQNEIEGTNKWTNGWMQSKRILQTKWF